MFVVNNGHPNSKSSSIKGCQQRDREWGGVPWPVSTVDTASVDTERVMEPRPGPASQLSDWIWWDYKVSRDAIAPPTVMTRNAGKFLNFFA